MVNSRHSWKSKTLLTPQEVSEILGVTEETLAVWRSTNRYDLPYSKIGSLVRYLPDGLLKFIESRTNYQEVRHD